MPALAVLQTVYGALLVAVLLFMLMSSSCFCSSHCCISFLVVSVAYLVVFEFLVVYDLLVVFLTLPDVFAILAVLIHPIVFFVLLSLFL